MSSICQHLSETKSIVEPKAYVCEECVQTGAQWVHLRTCQTCGATLCCDSSPNRHMTRHYHHTQHPVVISAEPDERWLWCYADEQMADY